MDNNLVRFSQQIAGQKLPRTNRLDGEGKILWFDIKYSRSTRRNLNRTLRYYLTRLKDTNLKLPAS